MESLLKPVALSPENGDCTAASPTQLHRGTVPGFPDVDRVLEGIRAGAENALYGTVSVESEELFAKHVRPLIEGAGLPVLQEMHYRWFLRELARLWRTRTGRDLAFHLELCIRKWVGLGLEPRTLQFLVCEAHERLKGKDLTTKTQSHKEEEATAKVAKNADGGDMTGAGHDPNVRHLGSCPKLTGISDRVPSPMETAKDAKTAKGGDMTELAVNSDRVPSPSPGSNPGVLS